MNQTAISRIKVKFAEVRSALTGLVAAGLLEKMPNLIGKTTISLIEILFGVMDEIEQKNKLESVPEEVAAFYNGLVEQYNELAEVKVVEKKKKEKVVKEKKEKVVKEVVAVEEKKEEPIQEDQEDQKEKLKRVKKEAKEKVESNKIPKEKNKRTGIGAWAVDGIKNKLFEGKSNKEIAEMAREKFGSNTTPTCIGWYKDRIKKGIL